MLLPHLVSTQSLQVCTVQWVPTVIPWYFGSFNPVYQTFTEHLFSIRRLDAGSREMRKWTQSMPTEVRRVAWTSSLGFKLDLTSSRQVDSDWVPVHLQVLLVWRWANQFTPLGFNFLIYQWSPSEPRYFVLLLIFMCLRICSFFCWKSIC